LEQSLVVRMRALETIDNLLLHTSSRLGFVATWCSSSDCGTTT
jgi:hypothetical protein